MQHAPEYQEPGYQEQGRVRREYTPQQPNVPYERQPAPEGAAAAAGRQGAGPLSWSDWVRWGPIWSGFFTIVATSVVLGALGSGIGWTVWGASVPSAWAIGWSILTGIIAYLLGGWVTARAAGVGGVGPAILNSALAWALSLIAFLVLLTVGAGNLLSMRGAAGMPTGTTGNAAMAAWTTFATLVIGLILAIIGGILGSRRLADWRGRRAAL